MGKLHKTIRKDIEYYVGFERNRACEHGDLMGRKEKNLKQASCPVWSPTQGLISRP